MIPRYTLPEMGKLWSEEEKFRSWLLVELLVCEAWAELGEIPPEALEKLKENARFDLKRIEEIEERTQHDLIAFLEAVSENLGDEARYLHMGLTSYDVEDTALGYRLKLASDILLADLEKLYERIKGLADKYRHTPMIGRTHGVHAEIITFGLKMAVWLGECERAIERLREAKKMVACGKISGAVGNYAHCPPFIEEYVCKKLGLEVAKASTQIVQRDRHAHFLCALALVASTLERFATEIRNLQRTEILELEEPFKRGQKGSSAMPHKRNPRLCERISGLAHVVRGYALAALEGVAQWHERDLSNSAPERIIIPDACILVDFMINEMVRVLDGLIIYPDRMMENIYITRGLVFSQRVLLALIDKGVLRKTAYELVQRSAMRSWEKGEDFKELLLKDEEIRKYLSEKEIEECFDINYYTKYVDEVLARFGI